MDFVIRIRKKTQQEKLILFVLFMPFTFGLLIDGIGFPSVIKYTIDIAWVILLLLMGINNFFIQNVEGRNLFQLVIAFWVITLIGFIISMENPLYYLWGVRNNFRFFVFFFSCVMFLREDLAIKVLNLFDVLYYFNFFVVLFQYYVLNKSQDYLGGIFGTHQGCNASLLIFLIIVIIKGFLETFENKESWLNCTIKCIMAIIISAFAELKVFFLIFMTVLAICMLITKFSLKKIVIILIAVVASIVGVNILISIFPYWTNWFNLESILKSAISVSGYGGGGAMNRLTGVPMVWEMFLKTFPQKMFGLGLGNCDTSAFAFLNTNFYKKYEYLRYNWFSAPFLFLETGILGLVCYNFFFISVYRNIKSREKKIGNELFCKLAKLMTMISISLILYNQSMRTEAAYMVYFVLALPFLKKKEFLTDKEDEEDEI